MLMMHTHLLRELLDELADVGYPPNCDPAANANWRGELAAPAPCPPSRAGHRNGPIGAYDLPKADKPFERHTGSRARVTGRGHQGCSVVQKNRCGLLRPLRPTPARYSA